MNRQNYHSGFAIALVVVLLGFALKAPGRAALNQKTASPNPGKPKRPAQGRVTEAYAKLPLSFEANHGQADPKVKFLSRGPGYTVFLTPTEVVRALNGSEVR